MKANKPAISPIQDLAACDATLRELLLTTLTHDRLLAARDLKVAEIHQKYATPLAEAAQQIRQLESRIEGFYLTHRGELEIEGKKSFQLSYGVIGMRTPSHPALTPLSEKWTWDKIEAAVRKIWKSRFFHKPKPPAIDKVKLKSELSEDELRRVGLRLDAAEKFYVELNRLATPEPAEESLAAPDGARRAA